MIVDFNILGVTTFGAMFPLESHIENQFRSWVPEKLTNSSVIRKNDFLAGRYCAYQAAKVQGYELKSLPSNSTREPLWPLDLKGSISHSKRMAISCVSTSADILSIGIDAEEILDMHLGSDFQDTIASSEELILVRGLQDRRALTILFSAKEALYKALFPITKAFIDFKEVRLLALDLDSKTFELELIQTNKKFYGTFKEIAETIITMVTIPSEKVCD